MKFLRHDGTHFPTVVGQNQQNHQAVQLFLKKQDYDRKNKIMA